MLNSPSNLPCIFLFIKWKNLIIDHQSLTVLMLNFKFGDLQTLALASP